MLIGNIPSRTRSAIVHFLHRYLPTWLAACLRTQLLMTLIPAIWPQIPLEPRRNKCQYDQLYDIVLLFPSVFLRPSVVHGGGESWTGRHHWSSSTRYAYTSTVHHHYSARGTEQTSVKRKRKGKPQTRNTNWKEKEKGETECMLPAVKTASI